MNKDNIERILNREQYQPLLSLASFKLKRDERILITGADGSIGRALALRLKQYKSVVPLDNIVDLQSSIEIDVFKEKLELILANNPQEDKWNLALLEIIKKDYEIGNIRVVDGWIISETELSIELLKKQYV